ncbi:hypothetical protein SME46J_49290 (plasmid) [Serratia marcescens]|nr:hypothetical protein SME46J_49290 [Serratia marcescens]
MKTVNMPARGSLVKSNGQLALQLLKTGNGGIPAAVQVLTGGGVIRKQVWTVLPFRQLPVQASLRGPS